MTIEFKIRHGAFTYSDSVSGPSAKRLLALIFAVARKMKATSVDTFTLKTPA